MPRRTFTRFRTLPRLEASRGPLASFLSSSSTLVIWLVGLALAILLVWYPKVWATERTTEENQPWQDAQWALLDRIERNWEALPFPPAFATGEEPVLKTYLAKNPLVFGLRNRANGSTWIREGDRLVPEAQHPMGAKFDSWFRMAEQTPTFQWFTPKALDPEHGRCVNMVLTSGPWMALKRWELGSPAVEQHLRQLIPEDAPVQVGLRPQAMDRWPKREAWGAWPNRQMDPFRLNQHNTVYQEATTNAFGEGWSIAVYPSREDRVSFYYQFRRTLLFAYAFAAFIGLSVGAAALLRMKARKRAALEADRLAALTHSLKTPLAILKFRCDSLRLGRLSPDKADEQLLRLGGEVDHLTMVIDNGLRAIKGDESAGPASEANPAFFREVAADLEPAFEAEERTLLLHLCEASGEASLPSLRSAVATLLENALAHGAGTVTLETRRLRRSLLISVKDEGPGLSAEELEALGRPFQRFRAAAAEGFMREGLGLGLSLLIQMAEREGWGLVFISEASGLTVELRIRLYVGRGLRDWFPLRRGLAIPLESK